MFYLRLGINCFVPRLGITLFYKYWGFIPVSVPFGSPIGSLVVPLASSGIALACRDPFDMSVCGGGLVRFGCGCCWASRRRPRPQTKIGHRSRQNRTRFSIPWRFPLAPSRSLWVPLWFPCLWYVWFPLRSFCNAFRTFLTCPFMVAVLSSLGVDAAGRHGGARTPPSRPRLGINHEYPQNEDKCVYSIPRLGMNICSTYIFNWIASPSYPSKRVLERPLSFFGSIVLDDSFPLP